MIRQAVEREPSDGILLLNAATTFHVSGMRTLIGEAIDFKRLRAHPGVSHLRFLHNDEAGTQPWRQRVAASAQLREAAQLFDKLLVLSPKNPQPYSALEAIYGFTRNADALRRLHEQLTKAKIDHTAIIDEALAHVRGDDDEKNREAARKSLQNLQTQLAAARQRGGATFAAAVARLIPEQQSAAVLGIPYDADEAVTLARTAYEQAPSSGSRVVLATALLSRAAERLAKADARFGEMRRRCRRVYSDHTLIAAALDASSPSRTAVLADADVRAAADLVREGAQLYARGSAWDWAMLAAFHPSDASVIARHLAEDEARQVSRRIMLSLNPASGDAMYESVLTARAAGRTAEADALLKAFADRGLPLP